MKKPLILIPFFISCLHAAEEMPSKSSGFWEYAKKVYQWVTNSEHRTITLAQDLVRIQKQRGEEEREQILNNFNSDIERASRETQINNQMAWIREILRSGSALNTLDKQGKTPLMVAAELGVMAFVHRLLNRGADLNVVDYRGDCARDLAEKVGNDAIAQLLLDCELFLEDPVGMIIRHPEHLEQYLMWAYAYRVNDALDYIKKIKIGWAFLTSIKLGYWDLFYDFKNNLKERYKEEPRKLATIFLKAVVLIDKYEEQIDKLHRINELIANDLLSLNWQKGTI